MQLSFEQLKEITVGAVHMESVDGEMRFFKYFPSKNCLLPYKLWRPEKMKAIKQAGIKIQTCSIPKISAAIITEATGQFVTPLNTDIIPTAAQRLEFAPK